MSNTLVNNDSKNEGRSSEFAQMNGLEINEVKVESNTDIDAIPTSLQEEIQVEEVVTTRPVAGHPLLKGLTVSGGVLVLVIIFGSMIGGLSESISNPNNIQQPVANKSKEETNLKEEDDKGQLKTAIAITSQKGELAAIANRKSSSSPTPSVSPSSPQAQAIPTATPTTSSPVTVRREPPPPPTYQPPPRRTTTSYNPQPIPQPQIQRQTFAPRAERTNFNPPQSLPFNRGNQKDPMQEWLAAGNVGNYSAGDGATNDYEQSNFKNAQVEGGSGTFRNVSSNQQTSTTPPNYDGKRVLVGTRASGILETPIAWVGGNIQGQQTQTSLIRLSQPLKGFDGQEVLPKGSYIVASFSPSNSEIVQQMTAVAALVNFGGKTQEKPITPNSILILGRNGNLLKAQSRRGGSGLGNSLMASLLSGLSNAAEIQNRNSSQITVNSGNGTTVTSTSNENRNLLAGFTEGTIDEILSRMRNANERQIQNVQQQQQVFVIDANTEVQIFVNQTTMI